jgi:hypothetical protein
MPIINELDNSLTCPYCNAEIPLNSSTVRTRFPSFYYDDYESTEYCDTLKITFIHCPRCEKSIINILGCGFQVLDHEVLFSPSSLAKQFPDFIPNHILQDYEEAFKIVNLSPKASATLSRRCVQAIIRDFYGISKPRLVDEINELKNKDIDIRMIQSLQSLRSISNIGAHPEIDINTIVDIDPGEAEKLLRLIEILIEESYIRKNKRDQLFDEINLINQEKQNQRNGE